MDRQTDRHWTCGEGTTIHSTLSTAHQIVWRRTQKWHCDHFAMLQWSMNSKNDWHGNFCSKDQFTHCETLAVPVGECWEGRQSHQRGAGQKMHRDEEKQSPEGRRKEVSWQNPTKWHVGERTRKLELSGQCTETKYISGISNWLSHGFGYHNLLIETEKLVQENGMYFFSPLLDFVLKI